MVKNWRDGSVVRNPGSSMCVSKACAAISRHPCQPGSTAGLRAELKVFSVQATKQNPILAASVFQCRCYRVGWVLRSLPVGNASSDAQSVLATNSYVSGKTPPSAQTSPFCWKSVRPGWKHSISPGALASLGAWVKETHHPAL